MYGYIICYGHIAGNPGPSFLADDVLAMSATTDIESSGVILPCDVHVFLQPNSMDVYSHVKTYAKDL